MKTKEIIKIENGGERLDIFVARHFDGTKTRSQITNAIKGGNITLNEQKVKSGTILKPGDTIEISPTQPESAHTMAEDIPLDIIYQDAHLIIINKPRGMVVHPGAGNKQGTLLNALLGHFVTAEPLDRAGIVHRIDKNTAGLMLVSKTATTQALLGEMFEHHKINRTYIGLVEGILKEPHGTINANIIRDPNNRTLYKTIDSFKTVNAKKSRHAVTHYKVLQTFSKHTLVEFTLETGRTHQIRVHCKSIGHPLVGDPEYNPKSSIKTNGQLLESIRIKFTHPITGQNINHEIPKSNEFLQVLTNLK